MKKVSVQITMSAIPMPATVAAADILQHHVAFGTNKDGLEKTKKKMTEQWKKSDDATRLNPVDLFKQFLPER